MNCEDVKEVGELQMDDKLRHELRQLYGRGGGTCLQFTGAFTQDVQTKESWQYIRTNTPPAGHGAA